MNAITVLVFDKNGNKKRGAKIRGSYNSFLVNGSTDTVISDSNGRAVLTFKDSVKSLVALHVNGSKTFKNKYISGGTYTLTI